MQTQKQEKSIVLLIGAPGAGKSILGEMIEEYSSGRVHFLSVGNRLRDAGLVEGSCPVVSSTQCEKTGKFHLYPTPAPKMERLRHEARIILEAEIERMEAGSILLLEFVKDIHDSFTLMEIIRSQQDARLLQVIPSLFTHLMCWK